MITAQSPAVETKYGTFVPLNSVIYWSYYSTSQIPVGLWASSDLGGKGMGVGVNFLHEKITQCPNVCSGTQIKTFKILTADDTALVKSSRIIWRLAY